MGGGGREPIITMFLWSGDVDILSRIAFLQTIDVITARSGALSKEKRVKILRTSSTVPLVNPVEPVTSLAPQTPANDNSGYLHMLILMLSKTKLYLYFANHQVRMTMIWQEKRRQRYRN